MALCHDITKIVPGQEKVRAFKRGHVVSQSDIPLLEDLGKEHIYVWEDSENLVHEDEAALRLAKAACGEGLIWSEPNQGKVGIKAAYSGLLEIKKEGLHKINEIEGIVLASLHSGRVVLEGTAVAGTRVIPLAIGRDLLESAERQCSDSAPLISVKPFYPLKIGIVTTGNEVYQGRIKDGFYSVLEQKIAPYQGALIRQVLVPDDPQVITSEIIKLKKDGAELVFVTGGMSVDPDDVTPTGIRQTGAEVVFYGVPVLPGSMLMLAYLDDVPICGIPGCVMFNGVTSMDLILPYLFSRQRVSRSQVVALGHGGLCQECGVCNYPQCSFGK
ncbi:MAG: molybdopterin-binding protein [Candidatus Saccharibacteria bacterium]